jgi:ribonuclease HI
LTEVEIYTDGACSPNPGLGGWGAVLIAPSYGGYRKEISGAEPDTTNNRMELMGAIGGLRSLTRPCHVRLTTDSKYVCNAFRAGWLEKWQKNGWQTSARQPVKNADLWKELIELTKKHSVQWEWVKGHSNHPENEAADRLAVAARESLRSEESEVK